jgi:CRISPR-associated protein (TIGR03986 family)
MEKARLNIYDSKKGKPVIEIVFEDGKKIPVLTLNIKDPKSLNGKEVEVEREKGQIVKIVCDGNEIYSRRPSGDVSNKKEKGLRYRPNQSPSREGNNPSLQFASAPYNFVSLNEKVVPAEEVPEFDKYHNDRFTGYIDLELKTITPLYIRDSLTMDEYKEKGEMENQEKTYINPDFFSPGGLIRIPGSSLRGMIRTLVEIMSFGKFEFFDDKRLYFRFFADKHKALREYYRQRAGDVKAGVLIKKGYRNYVIKLSTFNQIEDTSRAEEIVKVEGGWKVYSGRMQNKRHNWFIAMPDDKAEEIPVDYDWVIKTYLDDSTRKSKLNLIKMLDDKKFPAGVPCFYSLDSSGRVTAIGHTRYFRMPYLNTIKTCVTQVNKGITDIAEAIFGNEKTHAGRVFFEDAIVKNPETDVLMPACAWTHIDRKEAIPKILSGPKSTCIQYYLKQNKGGQLLHYDSPSTIRGYKLYWHKDGKNWIETELSFDREKFEQFLRDHNLKKENISKYYSEEKGKIKVRLSDLPDSIKKIFLNAPGLYETQHTKITPVRENTVFHCRIRFENLSKVELGALLFALDLPEGCAHKLGMGKPLGLGSIRIRPTLYLSDRGKRYTDFFAEWTGIEPASKTEIESFKKEFERYVLGQLGISATSICDIDRMKELKRMLDFNNKPSNDKTRYMTIQPTNEFSYRKVLPKPTEV